MLVLARKPGEKILVGEIQFEIVAIRGGKVRVGVTAPKDTPIARGELVQDRPPIVPSVEITGPHC